MDLIKGFDPLGNDRFRKSDALKHNQRWAIIALAIVLALATGQPLFLIGLAAPLVLKSRSSEELEDEERRVIECLRYTVNYNIDAARKSASGETREPMALHAMLEVEFEPGFISTLGDHELAWMKNRYDEMIEHYTENRLRIEKSRDQLREFGSSEQRQLEAYFRGKGELRSGTGAADDGGFDWSSLQTDQDKA